MDTSWSLAEAAWAPVAHSSRPDRPEYNKVQQLGKGSPHLTGSASAASMCGGHGRFQSTGRSDEVAAVLSPASPRHVAAAVAALSPRRDPVAGIGLDGSEAGGVGRHKGARAAVPAESMKQLLQHPQP